MILNRVRTVFTGVAGTPWYSNLYFTSGVGTPDDYLDMVRDFWVTNLTSIKSGILATVEGDISQVDDSTGLITGIVSGTALTAGGGGATDMLPPATQAILHTFTGTFLNGRQLRGKVFIPGFIESVSDANGAPTAALKTNILSAANTLRTAGATFGPWRVFSKRHLTSSVITVVSTPSKFGVLRSRRD